MDELHKSEIVLYTIYTDIDLAPGLERMEHYLGVRPDMYTNKTRLPFEFAPQKALVNLETMEIMLVEGTTAQGFSSFSIDDALKACNEL